LAVTILIVLQYCHRWR